MHRMTIRTKLVLSVATLLVISVAVLVSVLVVGASSRLKEAAFSDAGHEAESNAAQVARRFDTAFTSTRDLATTLAAIAQRDPSRPLANQVLSDVLTAHPEYMAAWAVWEPNLFDRRDARTRATTTSDKTGRYIPYWHRTAAGGVAVEPIVGLDDVANNAWYEDPKKTGQEKVLEPYSYEVDGKQTLMTSAETPIVRDGGFAGLAGVDVTLDSLSTLVSAMKPFGTGSAILVSAAGNVVAGGPADKLTKPLGGALGALAQQAVKGGTTTRAVGSSQLRLATPVAIGAKTTWALVVTIPESTVLAPAHRLRNLALVLALIALAVSMLAALLLARAIVAPINGLRDRMAGIADGDGDLTQRVDESPYHEIGQLGMAFNRFVLKVAGTVRGIAGAADDLSVVSRGITDVSGRLAGSARSSAEQASLVTDSAGRVTTNVEAVAAITAITGVISQISGYSTTIASAVEEQTATTNEMSRSVGDVAQGSREIADVIAGVADAATHTTSSAAETQQAAAQLADLSDRLRTLVGSFRY
ncbi:hypothetical protein Apa02nite_086830 [Actinoplanes palleronii]|uniref:HAMP domain-containing protein n=2 Tax=Actinoplanes palleronii TaxID=113570 RepID=A0ABQ4BPG7_9ACTN|nr:hypothetical protein Apa02nite_086830 [Actinoplanes palleronii]